MRAVSTAAGMIIGVTIEKIDQMLSEPSSRYMFLEGDMDRLLDARLELMDELGGRDDGAAGGRAARPARVLGRAG